MATIPLNQLSNYGVTPGQGIQEQVAQGPNIEDWFSQNAPPATQGSSFGNLSDPTAWMGLVGNPQQLTQWVQQGLGPSASPDLVQYYVGKIQGQPGANATEQAGSANYWMQKLQSDPTLHGGLGGTVGGSAGFSPSQVMQMDPGYQFRENRGNQGIQRAAAAKGTLLTTGTLKDLAEFNQGLASQDYGNIFNRNLSLANLGLAATGGQGSAASQYGTQAGNLITGAGNAQAAGTVGSANAWNQGLGGRRIIKKKNSILNRQPQGRGDAATIRLVASRQSRTGPLVPIDPTIPLQVKPFQGANPLQTLAQVMQLQAAGQQQQMGALELQQKQRQMAAEDALGRAISSSLKPDGSIDLDKLGQSVAGTPAAVKYPEMVQHFTAAQKATVELREAQQKVAKAEADHVGALANGADVYDDPNDKAGALLAGLASGIKDGSIPQEHGQAIIQGLLGDDGQPDPARVTSTIRAMKAKSEEQTKLSNEQINALARQTSARKPTTATLAVQAAGGDTLAQQAMGILKPEGAEGMITVRTMENGKPVEKVLPKSQAVGQTFPSQPPMSVLFPKAPSAAADKLIKVEHKDPETGRTVIEWLPQSEVRGQKFEKGTNATTENRLASAQAVNQTGEDIIRKLGEPGYAATVGPIMGRYNSVREWVGNPPPELSELAGLIESYSLANMGVHGMRSAQGAEMIRKLMESKQTPGSIISSIRGLNAFSQHFMQNEGRGADLKPSTTTVPSTGGAPSYQDYLRSRQK